MAALKTVITYDELLVRLENHIRVLEKYSLKKGDKVTPTSDAHVAVGELGFAYSGGESSRALPPLQFLAQRARDNVRSARIDSIWHYKPKVRDPWESRLNDMF